MTNIIYPLLIVLACAAVAAIVHRLTKPGPSRADLTFPARSLPAHPTGTTDHRIALTEWHLEFGAALLDYLDLQDRLGGPIEGPESRRGPDELDAVLERATDAHPFVEMRGELSAMRASVQAMMAAAARNDRLVAASHQEVYLAYRDAWLDRLRQFPADGDRITVLRHRHVPIIGAQREITAAPPPVSAQPSIDGHHDR